MAEYPEDQYERRHEGSRITSKHNVETLRNDFAQFDLSLLEYARLHKLTTDHMSINPFESDLIPPPPADCAADLVDSESLTTISLLVSLGALNGHTAHEKLDINKDAAELLASVIKVSEHNSVFEEWRGDHSICFKDLKVENPILQSDPELDLMRLIHRNTAKIRPDGMETFQNIQEPAFISLEKDAAMRRVLAEMKNERLDIDRFTIEYLSEICKQLEGNADDDTDLLSARKARRPSPETPPLLTSSPYLTAAPTLEVTEIELTSSPEDLIRNEALQIEEEIKGDDDIRSHGHLNAQRHGDDTDGSIYDILLSDSDNRSSPPRRKRLKDFKVEVPLMPLDSSEPPAKRAKIVSFSGVLHTMIPPLDSGMALSEPDDDGLGDFIEDVVQPLAESARKQIGEERLDELDTILRVTVPGVDDCIPDVPWKTVISHHTIETLLDSQKTLINRIREDLDDNEMRWSGVQRSERQLPWTPFPARLGKIDIEEELDEDSLAGYLEQLEEEDELNVKRLTCTRIGLKLLQDEDDDLLVEPGEPLDSDDEEAIKYDARCEASSSAPCQSIAANAPAAVDPVIDGQLDMQALLKKRKLALEAAQEKAVSPVPVSASTSIVRIAPVSGLPVAAKPTRSSDLAPAGGGLANFLHLHGKPQSTNLKPSRVMQQQQHNPQAAVMSVKEQGNIHPQDGRCITIPSPEVKSITTTFSLIVSPTTLADRELMREIRSSFPLVEIVSRDILPSRSNEARTTNREADITTSPSTGIISTTLQKLKQMPLPGQFDFLGIRDRIALVSGRYDRLLVLVSEGRRQDSKENATTGPLDSRDTQSISDLVGFAASLENTVELQFVAGGQPQLMIWLTACISHTAVLDNSISLMQDESIWERILRQAGLNPFAAQLVLSKVKLKDTATGLAISSISEASWTRTFGLAALSQMTPFERMEVFGPAVGYKIMGNLSKVLGGSFIPVARRIAA